MFFDIGLAILFAIFGTWFFNINLTLNLIITVIIFSLIPDIDFLIEYIKHGSVGGKFIHEHRELTHFPFVYIPITILIWILFGKIYGSLFSFAIFSHFLHDSVGIGWGIKWFWPFSKKSYKFFCDKKGKASSNFYTSWNPLELNETVKLNGDPNWIKNTYFKFTTIFIIEFAVLLGSLLILYVYLHSTK